MLRKYCGLNNANYIRILFLEMPKLGTKEKNVCILLITTYIFSLWNLKENHSNAQFIIRHINGKILKKHRYIRYALGDKFIDIDTQQFYRLKWDDF